MDNEMVEIRILIGGSRTPDMDLGKEDFNLFIDVLWRILWNVALERKRITENANMIPVFKKGRRKSQGATD